MGIVSKFVAMFLRVILLSCLIPSTIKFDRIDVSNILDANYVGPHDVLTLWGPLLGKSGNAALLGYFMNWTKLQRNGRASEAGGRVMKDVIKKLLEKEKVIFIMSNKDSMNFAKLKVDSKFNFRTSKFCQ